MPGNLPSPFANGSFSAWDACYRHFLLALWGRSNSAASVKNYAFFLNDFFSKHAATGRAPDQLTRADVLDYLHQPSRTNRSKGRPATPGTVNARLIPLRSFYTFAASYLVSSSGEGNSSSSSSERRPLLTTQPPTLGVEFSRPQPTHRAFSTEELRRFFSVIPRESVIGSRDRALFLFYFWTARRRSEVLRLTWGDLEQGELLMSEGKPTRQGWLYRYTKKGHGAQSFSAELPEPARIALWHYLKISGRLARGMQPDSPLFVAIHDGGHPLVAREAGREYALDASATALRLKHYLSVAGLDTTRLSLHSFRHTAARERYLAGEDVVQLMRLLGHSSLNTTWLYLQGLVTAADPGIELLRARFGDL